MLFEVWGPAFCALAAKARDPDVVLRPVQDASESCRLMLPLLRMRKCIPAPAVEYSRKLARYAADEDLIPGLGAVSLAGGSLTQETRARDLKELYKVGSFVCPQRVPLPSMLLQTTTSRR